MRYSIVIPVYNEKKTLRRCVESWLGQTEQDFELLLVDDGSADGSGTLCDELAREEQGHIRVIHQENSGVSAARNAGIQAAGGDFLLFTDSDDYVSPDYLAHMAGFQKETAADLVLCGFHHLYDGADIVKLPGQTRVLELPDFRDDFLLLYRESFLNMPWNKLYRRELAGRFETALSLGEDLLFNLDYLGRCGRIAVLAEPLCFYIQEFTGQATLSSQKRQDRMALARRICEETEAFFEETWSEPCRDGSIFTRYVSEILDECEKLPADRSLSCQEKQRIIHSCARDEWVRTRGQEACLTLPDYKILWYFLRRDMPRMGYALCVLRRPLVSVLHSVRRIGRGKS